MLKECFASLYPVVPPAFSRRLQKVSEITYMQNPFDNDVPKCFPNQIIVFINSS